MNKTKLLIVLAVVLTFSLAHVAEAVGRPVRRESRGRSSGAAQRVVVARMWSGRTPTPKADEYYKYLVEAGIKKIQAIKGNLGVQVFRRTEGEVTHFTVISYWESLDSIRAYAGDDIEKTHHLPRDAEYLLELPPTVRHFEVLLNDMGKTLRKR